MERSDGTGREKAAYARSICYRRRRRIADRTGSRRPGSGRVSSPMHPRDEPADGHRSVASHRPSVRSLALRCRRRELPPRCRRTRRPTRRQEGLFVPPLVGLPSGCPGLPCPALPLPCLAWPGLTPFGPHLAPSSGFACSLSPLLRLQTLRSTLMHLFSPSSTCFH